MPVPFFKSSILRDVHHGFFGSQGGVSQGLVSSLNCYPYNNTIQTDDIANVERNRQLILSTLNVPAQSITTAKQVHGDTIIVIKEPSPMDFTEADGLITDVPNLPIGVLTADCVPVLYADVHGQYVGAVHAGWKGAFLGIHLKMISKFNSLGVPTSDIRAVIGPSIQQGAYEVDTAFYDRFIAKSDAYAAYFYPAAKTAHYQFNLPGLIVDELHNAGVTYLDWVRIDTFTHDTMWFSHRRATLNHTAITGRQLSVISK